MDDLAHATWLRIVTGDDRGIRQREDTITETLLLDLDIRQPDLIVHRFNQNEENAVGADWEWFIGSDRVGWFCLRIQAKRVDQGQYKQLGHPGHGTDDYQYDTLIRSCSESTAATGVKSFPYYVFFNGFASWPSGATWSGCPRGFPLGKCKHASLYDFGCSAAPADLVRWVHGGRGIVGRQVEPHLSVQVPWSWLFGRPPLFKSGDGPIARRPVNPTTLAVLGWHQAQERVLFAIGALDALAGTEKSRGNDDVRDDAASESRTRVGASDERPDTENLVRGFWRAVSEDHDPADPSVLTPELSPYVRLIRDIHLRPTGGGVQLEQRIMSVDFALPRNLVITDLARHDG